MTSVSEAHRQIDALTAWIDKNRGQLAEGRMRVTMSTTRRVEVVNREWVATLSAIPGTWRMDYQLTNSGARTIHWNAGNSVTYLAQVVTYCDLGALVQTTPPPGDLFVYKPTVDNVLTGLAALRSQVDAHPVMVEVSNLQLRLIVDVSASGDEGIGLFAAAAQYFDVAAHARVGEYSTDYSATVGVDLGVSVTLQMVHLWGERNA